MSTRSKRKPLLSRVPADFVRAVLKGHSSLGLAFAAVIYLVCLTGAIAVFAHEFQRWELARTPRVESLSPHAVQRAMEQAYSAPAADAVDRGRMTYDDVIMKTGISFGLLVVAAMAAWNVLNCSAISRSGRKNILM